MQIRTTASNSVCNTKMMGSIASRINKMVLQRYQKYCSQYKKPVASSFVALSIPTSSVPDTHVYTGFFLIEQGARVQYLYQKKYGCCSLYVKRGK
jgi:hypothetical protein